MGPRRVEGIGPAMPILQPHKNNSPRGLEGLITSLSALQGEIDLDYLIRSLGA